MRQLITRVNRREGGFTLIEVMVVVVIIGVIAAVAIPNVAHMLTHGTVNVANTEVANVKTAVAAYFGHYQSWPDDSAQLADYLTGTIQGKYHFNESTWVTSAEAGIWEGAITWDEPGQKWIRK
jgi:prepilin-type N-terminal cleavage/methylation domain-containing protein